MKEMTPTVERRVYEMVVRLAMMKDAAKDSKSGLSWAVWTVALAVASKDEY